MNASGAVRTPGQTTMLALLVSVSMMAYFNRTALSIAGPSIMRDFGLSETQMGTVYSAFLFSYAILLVPAGWLVDRFGSRVTIAIALLGTDVASAMTAAAGTSSWRSLFGTVLGFQIVRLALGIFQAPFFPAFARVTAASFPPAARAGVQGLVLGAAPFGAALTPLLFGWLLGLMGWQLSLIAAGCGSALLAGIWVKAAKRGSDEKPDLRLTRFPKTQGSLTQRNVWLLSAGYFALNYFEYIFFYRIYYYFGQIRKFGAARSAVYTTILLLAMAFAMPLAGILADRFSRRRGALSSRRIFSMGGMCLSAVLLYAGCNVTTEWAMVSLLAIALAAAAGAEGPFWAAVIESGGARPGLASGMMNGIGNVGGLLSPIITPYVAERAGWSAGLTLASIVIFLGASIWLFLRPVSSQVIQDGVPPTT